jgi:hypothetical protein
MRAVLVAILALYCAAAAAQLRPIPQDAQRGVMRHLQVMTVELDGQPQRLAPGAQIRDSDNRIIVPSALPPGSVVKYVRDPDGLIRRVWVLTPEEQQQ